MSGRFEERERKLEASITTTSEPYLSVTDFWKFRKEMQEEIKVMKATSDAKEKFANERLLWLGLLIATWAGIAVYLLTKG